MKNPQIRWLVYNGIEILKWWQENLAWAFLLLRGWGAICTLDSLACLMTEHHVLRKNCLSQIDSWRMRMRSLDSPTGTVEFKMKRILAFSLTTLHKQLRWLTCENNIKWRIGRGRWDKWEGECILMRLDDLWQLVGAIWCICTTRRRQHPRFDRSTGLRWCDIRAQYEYEGVFQRMLTEVKVEGYPNRKKSVVGPRIIGRLKVCGIRTSKFVFRSIY